MDQRGPYDGGQPPQQSAGTQPALPPPPSLASSFNQNQPSLFFPADGRPLQHQPGTHPHHQHHQSASQFGNGPGGGVGQLQQQQQHQQPFHPGYRTGSPQSGPFGSVVAQPEPGRFYGHPHGLPGGDGPAGFAQVLQQQQQQQQQQQHYGPGSAYPRQGQFLAQQLHAPPPPPLSASLQQRPGSAVKQEEPLPTPIQPLASSAAHDGGPPPSRPHSAASSRTTSPTGGGHVHDSSAGTSRAPQKAAKRAVQSCSECRRRKIRCDRVFPCTPCRQRGDSAICREVEKHLPTSNGCASASDLLALTYRIASLEGLLQSKGVVGPGEIDRLLGTKGKVGDGLKEHWDAGLREGGTSTRDSAPPVWERDFNGGGGGTTDGEGDAGQRKGKRRKVAPAGGGGKPSQSSTAHASDDERNGAHLSDDSPEDDLDSETEDAAQTLEHLAFGRRRENPQPIQPSAHSPIRPILPLPTPTSHPRPLLSSPTSYRQALSGGKDGIKGIFDVFFQRSELFMEAFLSCLPGEAKERVLIDHYFARVEWFHHCLHRPTIMRQCEEFWAIPQERRASVCSPSWIGLLQMLLCLSLHFMDSEAAAAAGFSHDDETSLPSIWYSATRGALWQSDFLTNHSLENLQVIVLCGVYVINQDRADAQWGILGAGIKIAHMMGLNRLGPEQLVVPEGEQPKQWVGRWESLVTRETARRVWWQLVFLDWSLASAYGYSCTVHADQISCALPANVRDEDMIDGQLLKPQPKEVHTPMSYHLMRLRLCRTSYRVILLMNKSPHPPYDMVLAIDAEFKKIRDEMPEYFRISKEKPLEAPAVDISDEDLVRHWEKVISNLSLQTRWMRLHRPFLSKGYTNRKYAYSQQQCVRAARESIAIIKDGVGAAHSATFFERWWIPVLYTFFASCIICIDLLHTPRDADWDAKLQEVYHGLKYMKNIEKYSSPARGSVKVIETLLLEATSRPAEPSEPQQPIRKMSFDTMSSGSDQDSQASGLQRAVRRLVQANGAATSPSAMGGVDTPSPALAGSSPAPHGSLLKQATSSGAAGQISLRSPTTLPSSDPSGQVGGRPTLQQMSQSLAATGQSSTHSSPGRTAGTSTNMPPPTHRPGPQSRPTPPHPSQQLSTPTPNIFDQSAYGPNATFGGWEDNDFFGASNTGYGTFGGQPGGDVGAPPNDMAFLDNGDLMGQILSLPDLDWMLGPNGESTAF